ncbi:Lipid phosphate phosphatase-related protein type 5, partial [Ophiophagus hannah]
MPVPSPPLPTRMLYFQMVIMAGTVMLAYYFEYTDTFTVNLQGFFCYESAYRKPYPGPEESSAVPPVLLYSLAAGVPVLVVSIFASELTGLPPSLLRPLSPFSTTAPKVLLSAFQVGSTCIPSRVGQDRKKRGLRYNLPWPDFKPAGFIAWADFSFLGFDGCIISVLRALSPCRDQYLGIVHLNLLWGSRLKLPEWCWEPFLVLCVCVSYRANTGLFLASQNLRGSSLQAKNGPVFGLPNPPQVPFSTSPGRAKMGRMEAKNHFFLVFLL